MSGTKRKSTTLTLSILIIDVALASYAFMPVSTFAADTGNTTIVSPPAEDGGEQQANDDNSPATNETSQTTDRAANNANNQQAANNAENPAANNETVSNTNSASVNGMDTANASGDDDKNGDTATVDDHTPSSDFSKNGGNDDQNAASDNPKPQGHGNGASDDGDNKADGSDVKRHEKKLYDDSKDYQGPKFYKYKHDNRDEEQGDSSDGHKGEYYNSHEKKFFKYKHDFSYHDNVRIVIHHFYFKDFVGADFFVHFDYEYHHDGSVQIFFDHPFMDHEYDDEGRFYYDDDGNEYQCDEYYQGSVYYEFENAFYKCTDLTASEDYEGGY